MIQLPSVPVLDILDELKNALSVNGCAVLSAPTASGKTTVLPLALLDMPQLSGKKIIITEPRRLAAGAAAARLAALLGEVPGKSIGCRSRFENTPGERIEVVTDGVLLRMLQNDPALDGVGLIIFDEFHERSLAADLAFTLTLDARDSLRPDLMLMPASATGDCENTAKLLGNAPVILSGGKSYPVTVRYRSDNIKRPLIQSVCDAVVWSIDNDPGDILVFLPGEGEIKSVYEQLAAQLPPSAELHPLYGRLSRKEQEAAILPSPAGKRKIVLSTNVAESSLTIQGIRTVIDSGLERTLRYDPSRNMSTLTSGWISVSSAEQRRGRAGRTAPGVCTRLWSMEFQNTMQENRRPEILECDLSAMLLELAAWGVKDPFALKWLTPPPAGTLTAAKNKLIKLGALNSDTGLLTAKGKVIAAFGTDPAAGEILRLGSKSDTDGKIAAAVLAAVLTEENRGDVDFAERCSKLSGRVKELASRFARKIGSGNISSVPDEYKAGEIAVLADLSRLARRRSCGSSEKRFRSFDGSGFFFREDIPIAHCTYIAILSSSGAGADCEITLAAPVSEDFVNTILSEHIKEEVETVFADKRLRSAAVKKLGAIELNRTPLARCPMPEARKKLCELLKKEASLSMMDISETDMRHWERAKFLAASGCVPAGSFDEDVLAEHAEEWLWDHIKSDSFADCDFIAALNGRLATLGCYAPAQAAPVYYNFPSGRKEKIDYSTQPPTLSARVQEFYGMTTHPVVGEPPVRLRLELLSPARRPVQVTSDLPGFWKGSYAIVRKEMRAAYPKHKWPENPEKPE